MSVLNDVYFKVCTADDNGRAIDPDEPVFILKVQKQKGEDDYDAENRIWPEVFKWFNHGFFTIIRTDQEDLMEDIARSTERIKALSRPALDMKGMKGWIKRMKETDEEY
jgi:hypothetical protein